MFLNLCFILSFYFWKIASLISCNVLILGELFLDWYENVFIPGVKKRKPGGNEKFLLLLDNAPCHPTVEELNRVNSQFKVKYLPPNMTALMQSMDQGVIESMKRHYKHHFLQKLLFEDSNNSSTIINFIKKWNLLDTVFLIVSAWDNVSQETLSKAWKNLLSPDLIEKSLNITTEAIISTLDQIHQEKTYSRFEVEEWVAEDNSCPVCPELSIIQIIEKKTGWTYSKVIFLINLKLFSKTKK